MSNSRSTRLRAMVAALALVIPSAARAQQAGLERAAAPHEGRARVVLAEDFSTERLGDFPSKFEFVNGQMEIAESQGRRYLRTTGYGRFAIPLPQRLPEAFTLEFDYTGQSLNDLQVRFAPGGGYNWIAVSGSKAGIRGGKVTSVAPHNARGVLPVRVVANGARVEVYVRGNRVASAPNANLGRSEAIEFRVPGSTRDPAMIGNVRVTADIASR